MPAPSALRLAFQDDFNSFSGWNTSLPFSGINQRALPYNADKAYYGDATTGVNPFSTSGGVLSVTASVATASGAGSNPYSGPGGAFSAELGGNLSLPYNSGAFNSHGFFNLTYGYVEIVAKCAGGKGLWPGFWLFSDDLSGPPYKTQEIDILEVINGNAAILTSTHGAGGVEETSVLTAVSDTTASFHTYGVDWTPAELIFYFDGLVVSRQPCPVGFNKPMFPIFNLAVGGNYPSDPDGTTVFPVSTQIDRISAWTTRYTRQVGGSRALVQMALAPDYTATSQPNGILRRVFSEEFHTLDRSARAIARWSPDKRYSAPNDRTIVGNGEIEVYADEEWPAGAPVGDPYTLLTSGGASVLRIDALTPANTIPAPWNVQATTVSGEITTLGSFGIECGNIEIRYRSNKVPGGWPANWLLPRNDRSGYELDMSELFGTKPQPSGSPPGTPLFPYISSGEHYRPIPGAYGGFDYSTYSRPNTLSLLKSDGVTAANIDPVDGAFHTLAMEWTPDYLMFFIDGVMSLAIGTMVVASTPAYILINLAIAGPTAAAADAYTGLPAWMEIDYVRVCATKHTRTITGLGAMRGAAISPAFDVVLLSAITIGGQTVTVSGNTIYV